LAITNRSQLSYVGHSQGATIGIAALLRGDGGLPSKLKSFVGLAPVTYTRHQSSPLLSLMTKLHIDSVMGLDPDAKFNPSPSVLSKLLGVACVVTPKLCNSVLSSLFGDEGNLDPTRMGVYLGHWPDNTSIRNMIHWIRNVRSTNFNDYSGNPYSGVVNVPSLVWSGTGDDLADIQDVQTLLGQFSDVKSYQTGYAHMDFVWCETAASTVYPSVISFLQQHS